MAEDIIQPGDALPALFRVEQRAQRLHDRLTAYTTVLHGILADHIAADVVGDLDTVAAENRAALQAIEQRIRHIRHSLSRVLP